MRQTIDCLQAFRIRRAAETSFASAKVFRHPAHCDQIPQLRQLLRSQPQQCSIGDFTETYSYPSDHQVGQLIREQYVHWKFFHTHIGKSTMDDIYLSVDGRETRLDDNPSQELRRQFGELQKRVRALNNYTRFAINNIIAM